jgi:flagellar biosynthesis protein FlhA
VRTRLARQISESLTGPAGYIPVVILSPEWEDTLANALIGPPEDRQLALGPERLRVLLDRIRTVVDQAVQGGDTPAIMTGMQTRSHVYSIVDRIRMSVPVIAQTEIHRRAKVKVIGTI